MDVTWRRVKDCCGTPGETEVYPSDGGIVTCRHGIPWEPVGPLPASLADKFARARDRHIQYLLECGWKERRLRWVAGIPHMTGLELDGFEYALEALERALDPGSNPEIRAAVSAADGWLREYLILHGDPRAEKPSGVIRAEEGEE